MNPESITITRRIDKIERTDGMKKVRIYISNMNMDISRERMMKILSPSMMVDITFSPVKSPEFNSGNIYITMMGPMTIIERWKKNKPRTRYEHHVNSGIFSIGGTLDTEETLPFVDRQYYMILLTKHKRKTK